VKYDCDGCKEKTEREREETICLEQIGPCISNGCIQEYNLNKTGKTVVITAPNSVK
jgi:hypothetical protein